MFEAVFGRLPFSGGNMFEIASDIMNHSVAIPEIASPELRDLLGKILQRNASKRIGLEEMLRHPFFRGTDKPIPVGKKRAVPYLNLARPLQTYEATVYGGHSWISSDRLSQEPFIMRVRQKEMNCGWLSRSSGSPAATDVDITVASEGCSRRAK
jgi:serine/threonine protein kinase